MPRTPHPIALTLLLLTLAAAGPGTAAAHVRFDEVLAGANGDSRVAYVELELAAGALPAWGPQAGELASRALLTFHDGTGQEVASFAFPSDPPLGPLDPVAGTRSVLIATQDFADLTGLLPDYVIAARPVPVDGMVCFTENASNPGLGVHQCLAYGNYQGGPESDGCVPETSNGLPAILAPIAAVQPVALQRVAHDGPADAFGCGQVNADFALRFAAPRNSAGQTVALAAVPLAEQGRNLFLHETFGGNGRTCASCHRPGDAFGLAPSSIAALFAADPDAALFVAEHEPALATLENACLMREGNQRGLILENIDGFAQAPSFRSSPHLLNIEATAPYGLSEGFPDLGSFSERALAQHFPRTLARNGDPAAGPVDFRPFKPFELDALEAFMNDIRFPADGNRSLDRMIDLAVRRGADAAAIQRGRDLVTSPDSRGACVTCHAGPVLAETDGRLGLGQVNAAFDIGIAFRAENQDDGCSGGPGDPTLPLPAEFRRFSTPPLLGVANTAPFFHDGSAATLREAVAHYGTDNFKFSEAASQLEGVFIFLQLTDPEIDDIVAFLEAISLDPSGVPPACGDGFVDDDEVCDDGNLLGGDGCSMQCRVEEGFACESEPSSCEPVCAAEPRLCDANGDGFVDRTDLDVVFAERGSAALDACDPLDPDRDLEISVLDARLCAGFCDNPDCAPTPLCGLLGAELLPLAALALAARRRRRSGR